MARHNDDTRGPARTYRAHCPRFAENPRRVRAGLRTAPRNRRVSACAPAIVFGSWFTEAGLQKEWNSRHGIARYPGKAAHRYSLDQSQPGILQEALCSGGLAGAGGGSVRCGTGEGVPKR